MLCHVPLVYVRARERERAWKLGLWSVAGSLVLAPISIWLLDTDDYNAYDDEMR
jgi:hypothetical protein